MNQVLSVANSFADIVRTSPRIPNGVAVIKYQPALQAVTLISLVLIVAACTKSAELPNDLSCSVNDYPSAWENGLFVFDLNGVPSAGVGATLLMPKSGKLMTGKLSKDKKDQIISMEGGNNADGSLFSVSGSVRLHPIGSEGPLRYKVDVTAGGQPTMHMFCSSRNAQNARTAAIAPSVPVVPHIKAGGYICDNSGEVMGERQLRDRSVEIVFRGCQQVGADVEVNILGRDLQAGTIKVGNTGGVAWVDEHDLVGR